LYKNLKCEIQGEICKGIREGMVNFLEKNHRYPTLEEWEAGYQGYFICALSVVPNLEEASFRELFLKKYKQYKKTIERENNSPKKQKPKQSPAKKAAHKRKSAEKKHLAELEELYKIYESYNREPWEWEAEKIEEAFIDPSRKKREDPLYKVPLWAREAQRKERIRRLKSFEKRLKGEGRL